MSNLDGIKVGDSVVLVQGGWHNEYIPCRIAKVNKLHVFVDAPRYQDQRYRIRDGYATAQPYTTPHIARDTPELRAEMQEHEERVKERKLRNELRDFDFATLKIQTLIQIKELITRDRVPGTVEDQT